MSVRILVGDCRVRLRELADGSVDSVVCDPPYHLTSIVKRFGAGNAAPAKVGATGAYARASRGFMGQTWDGGDVAFDPDTWAEVLRVLKPGGHLVAFSGTRTYHRMACAIEDAGFEVRDQLAWVYGSGFPKSHDVERQIAIGTCPAEGRHYARALPKESEREAGDHVCSTTAESEPHLGWGTALKPAWEPIVLARQPLAGTVAGNVLAHGTGALNIDGCRVDAEKPTGWAGAGAGGDTWNESNMGLGKDGDPRPVQGRWPANIVHDGSPEVLAGFPDTRPSAQRTGKRTGKRTGILGEFAGQAEVVQGHDDPGGSAARFFYSAKTDSAERHKGCEGLAKGNHHPTVKPVDLMRWLCRLVTPPGGTVLDPFAGSGSTLIAADCERFEAIGCELSEDYAEIARRRVSAHAGMFAEVSVEPGGMEAEGRTLVPATGEDA